MYIISICYKLHRDYQQKNTTMEQIEILGMIRREMKNRHVSSAELARAFRLNPSSIKGMLNRPTLQVQRLADLSEFFNYNFFREIAQKLPYTAPDYSIAADKTEIANFQNRVRDLELEVGILRQTLKDVAGR